MGNAGSSTIPRERHKSSSSDMPSSPVLKDGQAFVFDNKYLTRERQSSTHDEEEPYYTKPATQPINTSTNELPLAASIASSESCVSLKDGAVIDPNKKNALPTVVHISTYRHPNSISGSIFSLPLIYSSSNGTVAAKMFTSAAHSRSGKRSQWLRVMVILSQLSICPRETMSTDFTLTANGVTIPNW